MRGACIAPAAEQGAATSVLSFFRSMGGTSVLGAILADRVASEMTKSRREREPPPAETRPGTAAFPP